MSDKRTIHAKIHDHIEVGTGKFIPGIPAPKVAKNYVEMLREHTGRNVIVYYSSYPRIGHEDAAVEELDITGFMLAMQGLNPKEGLDLVLQTPGGDPLAAEGIIQLIHATFHGDLRVIVPYCAYSAGTLISCAAHTIILGKHSFLGPVDGQLNHIPCLNIIKEIDEAREDIIANPNSVGYWNWRLSQYKPTYYSISKDFVALGDELLKDWLTKYMFADENGPEKEEKVERIRAKLNSNNLDHGRHFGYQFCKDLGLNVEPLEDDPKMQQIILGLHHSLEFTTQKYGIGKVIMSQTGEMYAGPHIIPLQVDDLVSESEEAGQTPAEEH